LLFGLFVVYIVWDFTLLIGGFAMHAWGYSRTTQDIDFLVTREDMPKVKESRPEDIIGMKVQSIANDPERYQQDLVDIEILLKMGYTAYNLDLIREYFRLFEREDDFEKILEKVKNAKR
jgi:hypothetical protein